VVVVVVVVDGHLRRGLGRPALGHVNDKGLVHRLAAGEVGIERPAHLLLGAQRPVLVASSLARDDAQSDIGCVEAAAQRVLVLFQDHVAHIVDEVVLADLDERGRGVGPLDPDLAVQHAGAEVGCSAKIVGRRRRAGCGRILRVWDQQRLYYRCIGVGDDRLATDGGGRSRGAVRVEGGWIFTPVVGAGRRGCRGRGRGLRHATVEMDRRMNGRGLLERHVGAVGGGGA
jgi:hypothetical protein